MFSEKKIASKPFLRQLNVCDLIIFLKAYVSLIGDVYKKGFIKFGKMAIGFQLLLVV